MKIKVVLATLAVCVLASCEKDPQTGPQGPQGPAGSDGQDGEDGNANVDAYQFTLNLSAFYHYGSSHVWAEPAPSSVPNLQADQLALVYVWMDPTNNAFEWVQQPFSHYYGTSNYFNEFFHGIESDGDLWLYIRNSGGVQPYTTMSGSLSYKVFIIESRMQHEMEAEGINQHNLQEVQAFFDQQGYIVQTR